MSPVDPPAGAAGQALIRLVGVTKSYGPVEVLKGIDLSIADGEFITVVGPSGSGKTTVLRLLGGFAEADKGQILLDGQEVGGLPPYRRPFNTVFQDYALFPHLTVAENVAYGLTVRRLPRREVRARTAQALERVALDSFGARYPAQLSGGQRQRVALARAIVCEPRLVLLDEPLGALDAGLRRQMQHFLKQLQRDLRTTFLFVTHDQEEAITMADRIVVMEAGRIVQLGAPDDVYYRPRSAYVARFFGDNNLIRCDFDPGAFTGRVDTPLGVAHAVPGTINAGGEGWLVIRPEAIRFDPPPSTVNRFAVRISEIRFAGPVTEIRALPVAAANTPDAVLSIKLPSRAEGTALTVGETREIGWDAIDCCLVPQAI